MNIRKALFTAKLFRGALSMKGPRKEESF